MIIVQWKVSSTEWQFFLCHQQMAESPSRSFHNMSLEVPKFDNNHIITYFVTRSVMEAASCRFQINKFICSQLQSIQMRQMAMYRKLKYVCLIPHIVYVCIVSTKNEKNIVYKLLLSFDSTSFLVNSACCGCPAGMVPLVCIQLQAH